MAGGGWGLGLFKVEHVPEPHRLWRSLARLLKRGNALVFLCAGLTSRLTPDVWEFSPHPPILGHQLRVLQFNPVLMLPTWS